VIIEGIVTGWLIALLVLAVVSFTAACWGLLR